MHTDILMHFIKIAELNNMTLAAKELFISQPSLSNQLKSLENELGVLLFERNSHQMQLTEAGYKLYIYAKKQLQEEAELRTALCLAKNSIDITLKIAVFPSSQSIMFNSLCDFLKKYENINIELHEADHNKVITMLENQAADVGIVRKPVNISDNIEIIKQFPPEKAVAVFLPDVFHLDDPSFGNISEYPLLINRGNESTVIQQFRKYHLIPRIRISTEFVSTLLYLAHQGVGIAIIPESYTAAAIQMKLKAIPMNELGTLSSIAVLRRKGSVENPIIRDLSSMLNYNDFYN